ncbi:C6 zinc finger domain-containing protein [Verticillium dahliae VdLs.17]|uniref:C6 zinc finger domain-containing protein n=1 Tax=Verticillium dahliae (strain VdLs.17 / ATCC MYA-4575 / FGSC 10137) TaxID=498257 RepID=G2X344_VERDV|nr:C6 zinc finger domain-containing protein [Verticillium dahliae VdLs.17]EGY23391.1 C6 zinc finger domain-containing protein [Verticillium dahliae VdLs.17]
MSLDTFLSRGRAPPKLIFRTPQNAQNAESQTLNMVGVPGRSKGCNTCRSRKKGALSVSRASPPVHDVSLHPDLARSAYEVKYLDLFWRAYLPSGKAFTPYASGYSIGGWTAVARDLFHTDGALRKALLAMCLGTLGRNGGEPWMVKEGLRSYTLALGQMTIGLRSPEKRSSDAFLVASRLMGLYELFVDSRMHLIITAIKLRKRNFLSSPEWKTIPWTNAAKLPKDLLLDIFVDIPGLLEDLDALALCDDAASRPLLYARLVADCWRTDERLVSWFEEQSPRAHLEAIKEREYKEPTPEDTAVAMSMSLYWTACLLTYSTLILVLTSNPTSPLDVTTLPERMSLNSYCAAIADILEIFFQPSSGIFSVQLVPLPLGIALSYLASTLKPGMPPPPKLKKLLSYFTRGAGGASVGSFLRSMMLNGMGKLSNASKSANADRFERAISGRPTPDDINIGGT